MSNMFMIEPMAWMDGPTRGLMDRGVGDHPQIMASLKNRRNFLRQHDLLSVSKATPGDPPIHSLLGRYMASATRLPNATYR
jgi:hypothetical protein